MLRSLGNAIELNKYRSNKPKAAELLLLMNGAAYNSTPTTQSLAATMKVIFLKHAFIRPSAVITH